MHLKIVDGSRIIPPEDRLGRGKWDLIRASVKALKNGQVLEIDLNGDGIQPQKLRGRLSVMFANWTRGGPFKVRTSVRRGRLYAWRAPRRSKGVTNAVSTS